MNDLALRELDPGTLDHDAVITLTNIFKQACTDFVATQPVDRFPQAMSICMTAAATFSGTICGQLIATGIMRDQDQRRAADSATRNFREGVKVGKAFVARVATENPQGTA
jgi:hypothetical protein